MPAFLANQDAIALSSSICLVMFSEIGLHFTYLNSVSVGLKGIEKLKDQLLSMSCWR